SMSLMATGHRLGPNTIARIISNRMTAPASAKRWRRNRRQASNASDVERGRRAGALVASSEGDAGVEPSIEDISDQVEQHHKAGKYERHRHPHRGGGGQDRAGPPPTGAGKSEDLLGHDGTAEHGRQLQGDQGHHRN